MCEDVEQTNKLWHTRIVWNVICVICARRDEGTTSVHPQLSKEDVDQPTGPVSAVARLGQVWERSTVCTTSGTQKLHTVIRGLEPDGTGTKRAKKLLETHSSNNDTDLPNQPTKDEAKGLEFSEQRVYWGTRVRPCT